jgi:hypothetical protein
LLKSRVQLSPTDLTGIRAQAMVWKLIFPNFGGTYPLLGNIIRPVFILTQMVPV